MLEAQDYMNFNPQIVDLHKNDTSPWPVLSIPGSSHENVNTFLLFFQKKSDANIEANS